MIKIFKVVAEVTQAVDVLVLADNEFEARVLIQKAVKLGEVEFEDLNLTRTPIDTSSCYEVKMTEDTEDEIKTYGIINEKADLICGDEVLKKIRAIFKKQKEEEFLKKHHMEFDFTKETKGTTDGAN